MQHKLMKEEEIAQVIFTCFNFIKNVIRENLYADYKVDPQPPSLKDQCFHLENIANTKDLKRKYARGRANARFKIRECLKMEGLSAGFEPIYLHGFFQLYYEKLSPIFPDFAEHSQDSKTVHVITLEQVKKLTVLFQLPPEFKLSKALQSVSNDKAKYRATCAMGKAMFEKAKTALQDIRSVHDKKRTEDVLVSMNDMPRCKRKRQEENEKESDIAPLTLAEKIPDSSSSQARQHQESEQPKRRRIKRIQSSSEEESEELAIEPPAMMSEEYAVTPFDLDEEAENLAILSALKEGNVELAEYISRESYAYNPRKVEEEIEKRQLNFAEEIKTHKDNSFSANKKIHPVGKNSGCSMSFFKRKNEFELKNLEKKKVQLDEFLKFFRKENSVFDVEEINRQPFANKRGHGDC